MYVYIHIHMYQDRRKKEVEIQKKVSKTKHGTNPAENPKAKVKQNTYSNRSFQKSNLNRPNCLGLYP